MPYMKDDVISKTEIIDAIEITDEQYKTLLDAKLAGKKVTVRNDEPFIYSGDKRTVYRLVNNLVESQEILTEDETPEGWQDTEPTPEPIDYSTLSKLKAIDYFIDTNQFDAFMAFIEADKKREQRWNAAQNLDIDDPMMDDYCIEFNVSEQELQGLFNALNTQQS